MSSDTAMKSAGLVEASSLSSTAESEVSSATSSVDTHSVTTNAVTQLAPVTLDDKYTLNTGTIFLSGIQALVRLPMIQRQRDLAAGLNTAGFISGYRGSPLGGLDETLWKIKPCPRFLCKKPLKTRQILPEMP